MHILIVGASGNLGREIARALLRRSHKLSLLLHKAPLPSDLIQHPNIRIVSGDLENPESLSAATTGVDRIVYVAGVLFRPRPEKYLAKTNTTYVQNIVDAALAAGVTRFILISFPHVEENTTPDFRAMGRLDGQPKSIHARTRLDAEKYVFNACRNRTMEPVVLRAGVIYGPEMKLIQAARTLMRYKLFAIWRKPTWVHLLALPDFLLSVEIAVERDGLHGVYNVCDDSPVELQRFVDALAMHWGYRKPMRLPGWCFNLAATVCEFFATMFRTRTPLTRDMICMAMTSVVADTSRMKHELRQDLQYPSFKNGLSIL